MRKEQMERFAEKLKIGKTYAFKKTRKTSSDGKPGMEQYIEYDRLIKKYPFVALFEKADGTLETYNYWQIMQMLRGAQT